MKRAFAWLNIVGAFILWIFGFDITATAPEPLAVLYYLTACIMFVWGGLNCGLITEFGGEKR